MKIDPQAPQSLVDSLPIPAQNTPETIKSKRVAKFDSLKVGDRLMVRFPFGKTYYFVVRRVRKGVVDIVNLEFNEVMDYDRQSFNNMNFLYV